MRRNLVRAAVVVALILVGIGVSQAATSPSSSPSEAIGTTFLTTSSTTVPLKYHPSGSSVARRRRANEVKLWNTVVLDNALAQQWVANTRWITAQSALDAARARQRAVRPSTPRRHSYASPAYNPVSRGSGRCGGDLPPCCVMMRESGGSLVAKNPHSSASGKWQFVDGTWNHYGGYAHAWQAPESVQDARAREVWAGGAGRGNWGGGC